MVPEEISGQVHYSPHETGSPSPQFVVKEMEVAQRLGVTRKRLRDYRDEWLNEGTDWGVVKKVPQWTREAADRVASKMAGGSAAVPVSPTQRGTVELLSSTQNPTIWMARLGEKTVRVYLRPDPRWHPGMEIEVRAGAQPNVYVYEGPMPRWKGKM